MVIHQPNICEDREDVFEQPKALQDMVESSEVNENRFNAIRQRIDMILGRIKEHIKIADSDFRASLIDLKTRVIEVESLFNEKFAVFVVKERNLKELEKVDAEAKRLIEEIASTNIIDDANIAEFENLFFEQNMQNKKRFLQRLKTIRGLIGKDQAGAFTSFEAALAELRKNKQLRVQGLEKFHDDQSPIKVGYKPLRADGIPVSRESDNREIDLDVKLEREGAPYAYEFTAYGRKAIGRDYGKKEDLAVRNKLLRLQQAIKDGKLSGATFEFTGRLDSEFYEWSIGTDVTHQSPIENVEIIYSLPLPSGKEYRLPLHRTANGLKFEYEEEFSDEDLQVIRGLVLAIKDTSLKEILYSAERWSDITAPEQIKDVEAYKRYEQTRINRIWNSLKEKAQNPRETEKISAVDERVTPEFVRNLLVEYQEMLKRNPQNRERLSSYVIADENYDEVVQLVMDEVQKIREFEQNRSRVEGEDVRVKRNNEGYRGPAEGYPLDINHILMDMITNITKSNNGQRLRSYDNTQRFHTGDRIREVLEDSDRRYIEIKYFDPLRKKQRPPLTCGNDQNALLENERRLVFENLGRASQRLNNLLKRRESLLKSNVGGSPEFSEIQSRLHEYFNGEKNRLLACEEEIRQLELKKSEQIAPLKNIISGARTAAGLHPVENNGQKYRELMATETEFNELILRKKRELLDIYQKIFDKEWDKFSVREVSRIDTNIMKLIYVINSDGEVIFAEEKLWGEDYGRAAHSELAKGRNIYGAGEIVLEKKDGNWNLKEINNGSGHYRPSHDTLPYSRNVICQKLGFDKDGVKLRNCIFRGIDIGDLPTELSYDSTGQGNIGGRFDTKSAAIDTGA